GDPGARPRAVPRGGRPARGGRGRGRRSARVPGDRGLRGPPGLAGRRRASDAPARPRRIGRGRGRRRTLPRGARVPAVAHRGAGRRVMRHRVVTGGPGESVRWCGAPCPGGGRRARGPARGEGRVVNRTERLYAVAEELRRAGPTGTTGARLAAALEVSERTIKRDVAALQQAGLTVWAQPGPGGGYVLAPSASLPPVNFTPGQAVAVAAAAATLPPGSPFAVDARVARGKVWDALAAGDRARAEALAARVWVRHATDDATTDDATTDDDATDHGVPAGDGAAERGGADDAAAGPGRAAGGDVVGRARTHLGVLRAVEQSLAGARVLAVRYRDGR